MNVNLEKLIERARYCRNTGEDFVWDNSWLNECADELKQLRAENENLHAVALKYSINGGNLAADNVRLLAERDEMREALETIFKMDRGDYRTFDVAAAVLAKRPEVTP